MKNLAAVLFFYTISLSSYAGISLWMISGKSTLSKVRTILLSFPINEQEAVKSHSKEGASSPEELRLILKKIANEGFQNK